TKGIPGSEDTRHTLDQLRAVDDRTPAVTMMDPRSGPWSTIWSKVRDAGKGDVTKLLQDPEFIKLLGKTGPFQRIITAALLGMEREISDEQVGPAEINPARN